MLHEWTPTVRSESRHNEGRSMRTNFCGLEGDIWWVPNPQFANPRVAEKAPWRSLRSGVAGVYSLLEIPTDSHDFPSHLWGAKKHIKKKRENKFFTGLSRDFGGDFVYVFFLPHNEWKKKKLNFGTHPVPGESRKFVYVYVFFSFPHVWHPCQTPIVTLHGRLFQLPPG